MIYEINIRRLLFLNFGNAGVNIYIIGTFWIVLIFANEWVPLYSECSLNHF